MSGADERRTAGALLEVCGRTYAEEAGIRLRDTPQPLYQLLVLATLLSARIRADAAVGAARALYSHGLRTPRSMAEASWQERVDALGEGGYRRYDESTSTMLGEAAQYVRDHYGGDLRRLHDEADGDLPTLRERLREMKGMGPVGADIFLREVQAVWPDVAPYLDSKAESGAERVGLPGSAGKLAKLTAKKDAAAFAAGLVRVSLDKSLAEEVRSRA
ncbi:endonuclease [Streptomyces alkaliterrae]|uniref:Endonuclease n=1 Tax=Streptomyces alkaliterrae TaxID=2213162 RepID=A0A5P0YUW8_9ACTN|nr:endonuclease [Streptomyces alkaliterrae]MBB1253455.1 endonuclease [Streptomyces alkaliterrae]MBB1259421.1 endonuclease [Streptomyces alkaliterrae]MQS03272.1 endonuclease [Streptomyces alkaliterrae]